MVHGAYFAGTSKNLALEQKLGCDIANFDGSFNHPMKEESKIHVVLDTCLMLKLTRSALELLLQFLWRKDFMGIHCCSS